MALIPMLNDEYGDYLIESAKKLQKERCMYQQNPQQPNPNQLVAGLFTGMSQAETSYKTPWEGIGHYYSLITDTKLKLSNKPDKKGKRFIIVEKVVLKCLAPNAVPNPHPPMTKVSDYMEEGGYFFLPNLKTMITAAFACQKEFEGMTDQQMEAVAIDTFVNKKLVGLIVEMENIQGTNSDGGPITIRQYKRSLTWPEIEAELAAEVKQLPQTITQLLFDKTQKLDAYKASRPQATAPPTPTPPVQPAFQPPPVPQQQVPLAPPIQQAPLPAPTQVQQPAPAPMPNVNLPF